MTVRRNAALAGFLLVLTGCGPSAEEKARLVTTTSHCTSVQLRPDLLMRLSSYLGDPDSIRIWVVQACHPTGTACSPILTYRYAPAPVYALGRDNRLVIKLLGGGPITLHNDTINMGASTYHVVPEQIKGNPSLDGVDEFKSQIKHRCGRRI